MRKPRVEDFDPNTPRYPLEEIDLSDITPIQRQKPPSPISTQIGKSIEIPRDQTVIPRYRDTELDTTIPCNHDTTQAVRKAVREIGKEAATHRFTINEKQAIAEIVFSYHQKGIRTSENEITRIALNYLVEDFRQQGDKSVLAKILRELNT